LGSKRAAKTEPPDRRRASLVQPVIPIAYFVLREFARRVDPLYLLITTKRILGRRQ
jgi:hypothetical protein